MSSLALSRLKADYAHILEVSMRASGTGRGGSDRYGAETDTSEKTSVIAFQATLEVSGTPRVASPATPRLCTNYAWFQLYVVSAWLSDGPISDKNWPKTADLTHKSAKVGLTFAWGSHRVSSESSSPLSDSALSGRALRPHDFQGAR